MEWQSDADYQACRRHYKQSLRLRRSISIQGKLVIFKDPSPVTVKAGGGERKEITEFSRDARFRMLKQIARIDWPKLAKGLFITLTYPDDVANVDVDVCTYQRHRFMQYTERYLHEKIPMLWAKEYIDRKSGEHTGKLVQHIHLSVFTRKRIHYSLVNQWWRNAIGATGTLATDVKRMNSGEHAAFYIAKYLTKKEDDSYLEYNAYLNRPGRHWGMHRKKLFPRCEPFSLTNVTDEKWQAIMEQAHAIRRSGDPRRGDSFTLLGDTAEEVKKIIFEILA